MEKQNLTQQNHAFTNKTKCTITQNKHKKTKARFSHLLWHLPWTWRGPILILVLYKYVTHLLTYLDTYPLTYSLGTHTGQKQQVTSSLFTDIQTVGVSTLYQQRLLLCYYYLVLSLLSLCKSNIIRDHKYLNIIYHVHCYRQKLAGNWNFLITNIKLHQY